MNEKEALTGLKNLLQIFKLCSEIKTELKDIHIMNPKAYKEAIETVLKELEKKDKMIDLIITELAYHDNEIICASIKCEDIGCKKCLKQYFENKANEAE